MSETSMACLSVIEIAADHFSVLRRRILANGNFCSPFLESAPCDVYWGQPHMAIMECSQSIEQKPQTMELFLGQALAGKLEKGALVARKRDLRDFEKYRSHASSPGKFSDHQLYLSAAGRDRISWIC